MTSSSDRPEVGPGRKFASTGPAPWELDDLGEVPELEHPVSEEASPPGPPVPSRGEWEERVREAHERGVEEGYTRGLEDGRNEGVTEGRREEAHRLSNVIRALEEALFLVRMAEEHRLSVVEENLSALAVAIARQVLGRELRGDPDAIADMVRRALVEFPIDQPLRVRLSPQDLSTIASLSKPGGEAVTIAPGRDLRWLADPLLEPGSCVIEGKERIVDGRIDRALERIYRRLTGD